MFTFKKLWVTFKIVQNMSVEFIECSIGWCEHC